MLIMTAARFHGHFVTFFVYRTIQLYDYILFYFVCVWK